MRVLVAHNFYQQTSGEDLVLRKDVELLRQTDIEVIQYMRTNEEICSYSALDKARFFPRSVYSGRTVREVTELARQHRLDVALVQNVFPLISPALYSTLSALGIPIVQLVYNYRFMCANGVFFTEGRVCERCLHGSFVNAVVHRCYKDSRALSALYAGSIALHRRLGTFHAISALVTPDSFLRQKLIEGGFDGRRIFPIANPFDVSEYQPRYGHEGYFAYLGRLVPEKGIFVLLQAMAQRPDSRLLVIGGGTAEAQARDFVLRNGLANVSFAGPKYGRDLVELVNGARALIVPSLWYDNSPLVIHQAYALGKPVVASRINGIPEVVTHRVTGLLFEPGNAQELADCIATFESDEPLREACGRAARHHAESILTPAQRIAALTGAMTFAISGHPQ